MENKSVTGKYFDISVTHNRMLENHKAITGIPINSHILQLIDDDVARNPEKYGDPIPFKIMIEKAKTVEQKVKMLLEYHQHEMSVRVIGNTLATYVAPMDRETLKILINKAVSNEDVYYKNRCEGRSRPLYGLKSWLNSRVV